MFENAVRLAIAAPPADYAHEACPDQYVGMLREFNNGALDFPCRQNTDTFSFSGERAILILESPHTREFVGPVGPAKGCTGRLIRQYLHGVLQAYEDTDFGVFIVNAIQNQCSLGRSPKRYNYRDAVFRKAWDTYGRDKFIQRITSLANYQGTLVINACTLGKTSCSEKSLREMVEDSVLEALNRESDIRIAHPASWASSVNRVAYW